MNGIETELNSEKALRFYKQIKNSLFFLIEDLRKHDYFVGTGEYLKIQELLLRLSVRGKLPANYDRLQSIITPILCKTRDQQVDFVYRYKNWVNNYLSSVYLKEELVEPLPTYNPQMIKNEVKPIQKEASQLLRIALITVILGLGLVVLYLLIPPSNGNKVAGKEDSIDEQVIDPGSEGSTNSEISINQSQATKQLILTICVSAFGAVIIILVLSRVWWRSKARKFLKRYQASGDYESINFFIPGLAREIFKSVSIVKTAQELRKHVVVETEDIDIEGTIERTIENGGHFTPKGGYRLVTPEYLILIDKSNFLDHHAAYIDSLLVELGTNELFFRKYYFDRDPRSCYSGESDHRPLTLRDLFAMHPDHQLLIFSDCKEFINPLFGEAEIWTDQLHMWSNPTILTIRKPQEWGPVERSLIKAEFQLLPATEKGLLGIAHEVAQLSAAKTKYDDLPRILDRHIELWTTTEAPDESIIERLISELRRYLGIRGFTWLSICAIYPELNWNLTLFLGYNINIQGTPIFKHELMNSLIQLTWFRIGYMPDWLRKELIKVTPIEIQSEVRQKLYNLFLSASKRPLTGFKIEISKEDESLFKKIGKHVFRFFYKNVPKYHPMKEKIFLTFMEDNLAFKVSEKFEVAFRSSASFLKLNFPIISKRKDRISVDDHFEKLKTSTKDSKNGNVHFERTGKVQERLIAKLDFKPILRVLKLIHPVVPILIPMFVLMGKILEVFFPTFTIKGTLRKLLAQNGKDQGSNQFQESAPSAKISKEEPSTYASIHKDYERRQENKHSDQESNVKISELLAIMVRHGLLLYVGLMIITLIVVFLFTFTQRNFLLILLIPGALAIFGDFTSRAQFSLGKKLKSEFTKSHAIRIGTGTCVIAAIVNSILIIGLPEIDERLVFINLTSINLSILSFFFYIIIGGVISTYTYKGVRKKLELWSKSDDSSQQFQESKPSGRESKIKHLKNKGVGSFIIPYNITGIVLLLLSVSVLVFLHVANYSSGFRAGVPTKIAESGSFIASYEGTLNVGGLTNTAEGAIPTTWNFSVSSSADSVVAKIDKAILNGQRVKLVYYEKYVRFPWLGNTKYFVYDVEFLVNN